MTTLTAKDRDRVLSNAFSLEFIHAKLIKKDASKPVVYAGSCNVAQDPEGGLQLKLYHAYQTATDITEAFSAAFGNTGLEPGKLIEDSHYFDFEGIDILGNKWTSPHIWISGDTSFPSNGKVVTAKLKRIECNTPVADIDPSSAQSTDRIAQLFIRGTFSIPFNKVEQTGNVTATSICVLQLPAVTCTLRKHETHLEVTVRSATHELSNDYLDLVMEGIGVAVGSNLRSQLKIARLAGSRQVVVYESNIKIDAARVPPPISGAYAHHAECFERFVVRFVEKMATSRSLLVGYWYRILRAYPNGPENAALVLSTSIEGMIKGYFISHGNADEDFLKQVAEVEPLLKAMLIGERARKRLLSALGSAKSPSPKNALFALKKSAIVSEQLISLWTKLRNKSAHADELNMDDHHLQNFINELHGCLELFYRLVIQHIEYTGKIIEYAKPGWPEGDLTTVT